MIPIGASWFSRGERSPDRSEESQRRGTAGVRVFSYLEDRERTLDSPTDKIPLSLTAPMNSSASFGYDNIEVTGSHGARSHVEQRINETGRV